MGPWGYGIHHFAHDTDSSVPFSDHPVVAAYKTLSLLSAFVLGYSACALGCEEAMGEMVDYIQGPKSLYMMTHTIQCCITGS